MFVARDAASFVDGKASAIEVERGGITLATHTEKHRFTKQPLAAFELDGDTARLRLADFNYALT
jgi:hypothetical protein